MRRALVSTVALACLWAAAGCHTDGRSVVTLDIGPQSGTLSGLDHVEIVVTDATHTPARKSKPISAAVPNGTLPPALEVPLAFDRSVDGQVTFDVDAVFADGSRVSGSTSAHVAPYQSIVRSVDLPAPVITTPPGDMATCAAAVPTHARQFVINVMTVPYQRADDAIDLNGDGHVDNALGALIQTLKQQSDAFDPGASMEDAVHSGQNLVLLTLRSSDATFQNDPCAVLELQHAAMQANPDFSGMGHFTATGEASRFSGALTAGAFSSAPLPPVATKPVVLNLVLPFADPTTSGPPMTGTHVSFSHYDPSSATDNILRGQLHGALDAMIVPFSLVPGLQKRLQTLASANPCDTNCDATRQVFDTGGTADAACAGMTCRNPDTTCAVKNDGKIDYCEVATSAIVKSLLGADVQLTDGMGHYMPNPANTTKDSWSVGLGFSAVAATY